MDTKTVYTRTFMEMLSLPIHDESVKITTIPGGKMLGKVIRHEVYD
jgi:hypothetical protein